MNSVLLVLFPFLLTACGEPLKKDKENVLPRIFNDSQFSDSYFIEDLECQLSQGLPSIDSGLVYRFDKPNVSAQAVELNGFTSRKGLKAPGVAETLYGFHQIRDCELTLDGQENCQKNAQVKQSPAVLKVCKTPAEYKRHSIEGVALTSLYFLGAAHDFYSSIATAVELTEARLLVLPRIEKSIADTKTPQSDPKNVAITDNLAYTQDFGGLPAFAVFPKSRASRDAGLWQNLNLWEIPWTLAHEFAHHVFRTHTGIVQGNELSIRETGGHDHSSHGQGLSRMPKGRDKLRQVSTDDVVGAVNEGFADLFAYYSSGERQDLVSGVDCFEANREVTNSSFSTGQEKFFDSILETIFFSETDLRSTDCDKPDFQDIHTVGAVIAHFGHKMIDSLDLGSSVDKADILLKWGNAIKRNLVERDSTLSLENLIGELLGVTSNDQALTTDQCQTVRQIFPVYSKNWLSEGQFTCDG